MSNSSHYLKAVGSLAKYFMNLTADEITGVYTISELMLLKAPYIVSIDGSTTKTGIAVYDKKTGELVWHTVIAPKDKGRLTAKEKKGLTKQELKKKQTERCRQNMDMRIEEMIKAINRIFERYQPQTIVMEDTYAGKDMYAYKKLCQLQGLGLNYAIQNGVTFILKFPSSWRKDIGFPAYKKNGKNIQREEYKVMSKEYVKKKYGLDVSDDEADAICLGDSVIARCREVLQ